MSAIREFVRCNACGRHSQRCDLVLHGFRSGLRRRRSHDFSARRLAKSPRNRQTDSLRPDFLRRPARRIRRRTFHASGGHRIHHSEIHPVAHVLGALHRRMLHRGIVQPGHADPGAPLREPRRTHILSFRHADGCAGLGSATRQSHFCDPHAARIVVQRRRTGLRRKPRRRRRYRGLRISSRRSRDTSSASAILVYSIEQFLHGDHVPGVPLEPLTPTYIWGHAIWGYVAAIGYLIAGVLLLVGKKTRAAATLAALSVSLDRVGRVSPDRGRPARQPRPRLQLHGRHADVLRRGLPARRRNAARRSDAHA